ncbi:MAG: MFS transporter [Desulfurococcales archaeon]|nr:MFS transporter [Desulfurococcales archaeon]
MSGDSQTSAGGEMWRYTLILAGVLIAGVGAGVARPALTYYLRYDIGSTVLAAASLTSSFMLGRTLGSIISGVTGARAPGRRHLLASLPLAGAALVIYSFPQLRAPPLILGFTGVWGLMAGVAWPTVQVGVSDVQPRRSTTLLSIYFAVGTLGISVGNELFGVLETSYSSMLKLGSLLILSSTPLFALSLYKLPRSGEQGRARTSRGWGDGVILYTWILAAAFALGFLSGVLRDYFYIYAHETLGLSRGALGHTLAAAGVLGVAVSIPMGVLADKYTTWRVLPPLLALALLGSLLLLTPRASIPGYILAALSVRASLPQTRNAALAPGGRGSLLVGASNSMSSIGMTLSPIIAGIIHDKTSLPPQLPYLTAALLIAATLLPPLAIRKTRRPKTP